MMTENYRRTNSSTMLSKDHSPPPNEARQAYDVPDSTPFNRNYDKTIKQLNDDQLVQSIRKETSMSREFEFKSRTKHNLRTMADNSPVILSPHK